MTTGGAADDAVAELRARVARLERRNELQRAVLHVLFALLRILKPDLDRLRVPAPEKAQLLRAIRRTRGVFGLRRVLAIVGLYASRVRAWRSAERGCLPDDQSSCPKSSPTRLTATGVSVVREMVTSPDPRHVSNGPHALAAARLRFAPMRTGCLPPYVRHFCRVPASACVSPHEPGASTRSGPPRNPRPFAQQGAGTRGFAQGRMAGVAGLEPVTSGLTVGPGRSVSRHGSAGCVEVQRPV